MAKTFQEKRLDLETRLEDIFVEISEEDPGIDIQHAMKTVNRLLSDITVKRRFRNNKLVKNKK